MAINGENGVSAVTVDELLKQGLRIPNYQRPYSWDVSTALQLVDDISEALRDTERKDIPYVLGAIILHDDGEYLNVVDGQQRLLTLRMILAALDPINHQISMSGNSETPVSLVWIELQRRLSQLEDKKEFLDFICHKCQLVRIVTDDIDEAFRVFDSQNYRGKPLAPHDLLKAHHLREMHDESAAMKVAVVEAWEAVNAFFYFFIPDIQVVTRRKLARIYYSGHRHVQGHFITIPQVIFAKSAISPCSTSRYATSKCMVGILYT
jgi:hypothetical protein